MADGVSEGSDVVAVEVAPLPARRKNAGERLNVVGGGLAVAGLIIWMIYKGAADISTLGLVLATAAVWVVCLLSARQWATEAAAQRTVEVPTWALLRVGDRERLPASELPLIVEQVGAAGGLAAPAWLGLGAPIIISMGLAGTFLGLSMGLLDAVPALNEFMSGEEGKLNEALIKLLEGAKLAFIKSLAGIVLGTLWSIRMSELRELEGEALEQVRKALVARFPPVTPEALLGELLAGREGERQARDVLIRGAASFVVQRVTEVVKEASSAAEQGAERRSAGLLAAVSGGSAALTQALAPLDPLQAAAASAAKDLHELRGGEDASVSALIGKLDDLQSAVNGAVESLPAAVGTASGTSFGNAIAPNLSALSTALAQLSSQGGEAIGDAFKDSVGQQTNALSAALVALTESLKSLPQGVADSGVAARQVIEDASSRSAGSMTTAAAALQASAEGSAEQLRGALAEVQALVDQLRADGQQLHGAFTGVAAPLQALPEQLKSAGAGIEQAGRGLQTSGEQLTAASDKLAAEAQAAAGALAAGGRDLAQGLTEAREQLGKGFTTELVAIQGALGAQLTAQEGMLAGTKAQHELMARSADMARQRLESLNDKSTALVEGIETLRQTCADTVAALQAAAGDQRSGADQAVQDLLTAVAKFSESLDKSQGAVQDASLRAVASTEQVTAEAARRVADALVQGADRFEQSMGRVEQVGQRLDAHGQALEKNLSAAQGAAAALTGHGEALVRSAGALRAELAEVVSPLSDARSSLMTVPGAVNAAVTALGTERTALSSLSTSLKDQAELVRAQERELANRAAELRRVTDALGGQIAQHVDRLTKAQEKVAETWQTAAAGVDLGVEKQAKAIATYAKQVSEAVGIGPTVEGLTDALSDLAAGLEPLKELPQQIAALQQSIAQLEAALDGGAA